jgi:hypothetical protein
MNEDKTDALLVSTKDRVKKQLISSIPLVVGGAHIFPSQVVQNLGVLLDSHLSVKAQINSSLINFKLQQYRIHFKGLILNFLHQNWPTLLRLPFLELFVIPVVIVKLKATEDTVLSFYSIPKFEEWKTTTENLTI